MDVPKADAVLAHVLESTLPHQRDVARVRRRQAPGEEGGDCIAAHYTDALCQLQLGHDQEGVGGAGGGVFEASAAATTTTTH